MVKRRCDACGRKYEAKTPRSQFCKETDCKRERARLRKRTERTGAVIELRPPLLPAEPVGLVESVTAKLSDAGVLDSFLGQAALQVAKRMVHSERDTGSSVASLNRELRSTMKEALEEAQPESRVDELRRKREAKLAGRGA